MVKRLLIQTQLSNIVNGKFDLACDSGWQMVMGRVREMLRLNPELDITVMGPLLGEDSRERQVVSDPWDVNPDLWEKYDCNGENRLHYFEHRVIPSAIVTRYDFDWTSLAIGLDLGMQKLNRAPKWDAVYINDPMHLRAFRAMFHTVAGYQPKFFVHSHFVDCPSSPKFPAEASLWLGQCEATLRADWNFWQCDSALNQFEADARELYRPSIVDKIITKSSPWDDGFSASEINSPVNYDNIRFDPQKIELLKAQGKTVLFFPNRISPGSGDYTNGMKFMFELLPELRRRRQDFVVVCGNPNMKFSNDELLMRCGPHGYVKLHDHTLNRDEFKLVARQADIAVSLYNVDTYGGTASRECVELGCNILWPDYAEYSRIAREAGNWPYLTQPDLSDLPQMADALIHTVRENPSYARAWQKRIRKVIWERCSYESTTPRALQIMDLTGMVEGV